MPHEIFLIVCSGFLHLWTVQNKRETYSDLKIVLVVPKMHSARRTYWATGPCLLGECIGRAGEIMQRIVNIKTPESFSLAAHGIPLRFYKSAKQGCAKVKCTAVKGGTCKKTLKVTGGPIRNSTGMFTERAKLLLSDIWDETNK